MEMLCLQKVVGKKLLHFNQILKKQDGTVNGIAVLILTTALRWAQKKMKNAGLMPLRKAGQFSDRWRLVHPSLAGFVALIKGRWSPCGVASATSRRFSIRSTPERSRESKYHNRSSTGGMFSTANGIMA